MLSPVAWEIISKGMFCESRLRAIAFFLTSSLRHPKIFIKEFGDFLMPCHQHCLSVYPCSEVEDFVWL